MAETKYFTYEGGIYPYDATYIQGEVKHSVQDFLQEYDKRVKGYQVPALVVDNGEQVIRVSLSSEGTAHALGEAMRGNVGRIEWNEQDGTLEIASKDDTLGTAEGKKGLGFTGSRVISIVPFDKLHNTVWAHLDRQISFLDKPLVIDSPHTRAMYKAQNLLNRAIYRRPRRNPDNDRSGLERNLDDMSLEGIMAAAVRRALNLPNYNDNEYNENASFAPNLTEEQLADIALYAARYMRLYNVRGRTEAMNDDPISSRAANWEIMEYIKDELPLIKEYPHAQDKAEKYLKQNPVLETYSAFTAEEDAVDGAYTTEVNRTINRELHELLFPHEALVVLTDGNGNGISCGNLEDASDYPDWWALIEREAPYHEVFDKYGDYNVELKVNPVTKYMELDINNFNQGDLRLHILPYENAKDICKQLSKRELEKLVTSWETKEAQAFRNQVEVDNAVQKMRGGAINMRPEDKEQEAEYAVSRAIVGKLYNASVPLASTLDDDDVKDIAQDTFDYLRENSSLTDKEIIGAIDKYVACFIDDTYMSYSLGQEIADENLISEEDNKALLDAIDKRAYQEYTLENSYLGFLRASKVHQEFMPYALNATPDHALAKEDLYELNDAYVKHSVLEHVGSKEEFEQAFDIMNDCEWNDHETVPSMTDVVVDTVVHQAIEAYNLSFGENDNDAVNYRLLYASAEDDRIVCDVQGDNGKHYALALHGVMQNPVKGRDYNPVFEQEMWPSVYNSSVSMELIAYTPDNREQVFETAKFMVEYPLKVCGWAHPFAEDEAHAFYKTIVPELLETERTLANSKATADTLHQAMSNMFDIKYATHLKNDKHLPQQAIQKEILRVSRVAQQAEQPEEYAAQVANMAFSVVKQQQNEQ